ncbi:MAG TPA: fibronectin type III domain-containing protein [Candidatus Saccharimonadales bacterium]|nr:fibronectin type III domain-containing protein [Candidatus Saccharimonadales bacterium]
MKLFKRNELNQKGFGHHVILPLIVIALITIVGVRVMLASHAAAPTFSATVSPPTNLALNTASTTDAALTWSPSTTSGVTYSVLENGTAIGTTDSYTTNYLATGLTPGEQYTYSVEAVSGSDHSAPTASLAVTTGTTTKPITSCGTTITKSGDYVLTGNIKYTTPNTDQDCLFIANVKNVSINCMGHTINLGGTINPNFFSLENVSNFLLTNCRDVASYKSSATSFGDVNFDNVTNATVENNKFGNSYAKYKNDGGFSLSSEPGIASGANVVINNNKFTSSKLV